MFAAPVQVVDQVPQDGCSTVPILNIVTLLLYQGNRPAAAGAVETNCMPMPSGLGLAHTACSVAASSALTLCTIQAW